LSLEPDCYIKEGILGIRPSYKAIFLAPANQVVNLHFLEYWRQYSRHIRIVTSPICCHLLYPLTLFKWLQYDVSPYCMNDHETATCYAIHNKWDTRPPLLTLRKTDSDRGWDCLRELGVPEGAWFVCIHARESADGRNTAHLSRDVSIDTYLPAIEAITKHGGWCIRLGDNTMKPLPPMNKVIDYALLDIKSEWMDVFLCGACRFVLGSNSGLSNVAGAFGVPCALANLIPISVLPVKHSDLGILKLLWSFKDQRYLTFREILDSPIGNANFFAPLFHEAGVKIVDNSPEDIRDLAIEMLERMENSATYTDSDESLQQTFKSFFKPGHYGYGASSRIGRDFLRRYKGLLI
jgi:putative glycosyltransferase (TIGR04372 family)